jgi:hypothetical protein
MEVFFLETNYMKKKYIIWIWIWLILKNISMLDRIWSLRLVRFTPLPTNFIFWLGRLIFLGSINSHPDNIYVFVTPLRNQLRYYLKAVVLM